MIMIVELFNQSFYSPSAVSPVIPPAVHIGANKRFSLRPGIWQSSREPLGLALLGLPLQPNLYSQMPLTEAALQQAR